MLHILTIDGQEEEGAYSVADSLGEKILYIWEEEDDAVRFAMMLEEDGFPEMNILEVEDEVLLKTCEMHEYQYTIITKNDFVIPPKQDNDSVQEDSI
jgi:hypothetical protein|tara:strand:- start:159 stop:449 length:291 start_codon:yes stop_codon:yes gene_type:complete